MNDQMMRVISSPSSSTTGFFTLIFAMRRGRLSASRDPARTADGAALLAQRALVLDALALPARGTLAVVAAQRPRARARVEADLPAQQPDRAAPVRAQAPRARLRQPARAPDRPARLRRVADGVGPAHADLVRARAQGRPRVPLDDLPAVVVGRQLGRHAEPV